MHILVLGAGLVGVSSAWYLREAGYEVSVVDRQPAPAMETSFANGGQISTSHAEPWANPATPLKVLRWLGREDSPLLWRLRADAAQWAWGLRFLRECAPGRTRANIVAILRLALYSRALLKELRPALGLEYDQKECGILHFYTDEAEFAHAIPQAELMRRYGCDRVVKSAAECLAIEPSLAGSTVPIVGGTYTAEDESGDARKFATELARKAAERGVAFRFDAAIESIEAAGGKVTGVRLAGGERLSADAYVVADELKPGYVATPLIEEKLIAVQAPSTLRPDAKRRLITTDVERGAVGQDWIRYCRTVGIKLSSLQQGQFRLCTHFFLALELARRGYGVALIPDFLAAEDIRSGTLVPFSDRLTPSGRTYHLCIKKSRMQESMLVTLSEWLTTMASGAPVKLNGPHKGQA